MTNKALNRIRVTKNKQAFTLIELIIVIAVLGIIILLAAPRFIGKTDDALVAQMKNDVRAAESKLAELRVIEDEQYWSWDSTTDSELQTLIDSNSLYGKRGPVNNIKEDEYKIIPDTYIDKEINSKLNGTFYANSGGEVFYHGEPGLGVDVDINEKGIDIPEYYVEATDDDFLKIENDWSSPNGSHYYLYTGDEDYVIVPEKIHGEVITDTHHMFGDFYVRGQPYVQSEVKGVAMDNPNITDTSEMFFGSIAESLELDYLNTENVTNMTKMFQGLETQELDLSNFSTASAKTLSGMFVQSKTLELDLSNFDTSKVTDMSFLFEDAGATVINVENLDTSDVTNMNGMFRGISASVDLSNFDTSQVNTMNSMFYKSNIPSIDLNSFDTSNVKDMSNMFHSSAFETLNLSMFDTRKVTSMNSMFLGSQATDIDLSSFDTQSVTDMQRMFQQVKAPTLDLSSFDLTDVSVNDMLKAAEVTKIYARTIDDAEIMDQHFVYKPNSAVIIVKN